MRTPPRCPWHASRRLMSRVFTSWQTPRSGRPDDETKQTARAQAGVFLLFITTLIYRVKKLAFPEAPASAKASFSAPATPHPNHHCQLPPPVFCARALSRRVRKPPRPLLGYYRSWPTEMLIARGSPRTPAMPPRAVSFSCPISDPKKHIDHRSPPRPIAPENAYLSPISQSASRFWSAARGPLELWRREHAPVCAHRRASNSFKATTSPP